ncbi:hypothetical protein GCM10007972_09240 [Iodidimonas muriae]|nr:hypothetical protein JCM17843_05130 [Kordiimonadales bacterium JCM 17843]GGO08641.1 hypothetical protein GCM10007972_09240 [Iodidimonas muriae]
MQALDWSWSFFSFNMDMAAIYLLCLYFSHRPTKGEQPRQGRPPPPITGLGKNEVMPIMKRVWLIIVLLAVLAVLAGTVWLYTWDIPAPQERVEQELPDDLITN